KLHDWARRQAEQSGYKTVGIYAGALGFGYNPELLQRKKLPPPTCWKDLVKPEYRDEVQVANPNSSGTAYTAIATIVQLFGEEEAFRYLRQLHRNVNQYTRSGVGPIKAVARGETSVSISFMHDGVTEAGAGAMRNGLRAWALTWSLVGVAGWALLPWYAIADGIFSPGWPARILADRDLAPAALQAILFGRAWLMGPGLALLAALVVVLRGGPRALFGGRLMMFAGPGVLFSVAQGFAIGQPPVGAGAALTVAGLLLLFSTGLAARGF